MHFSQKLAASLAFAGLVAAAPVEKRAYTDGTILNYALTLEHLEATFYKYGLDTFGVSAFENAGYPDWVRYRLTEIASQEATHVTALTGALSAAGVTPVAQCTYDFSSVTSVESFLATAQVLEGVGVAAYQGAAPSISSKDYLAVAAAILSVEVEHDTWERSAVMSEDGFPRAFSPSLDFNQVYTLAAPFFKACNNASASSLALGFNAFPTLTVSTAGPYYPGQTIDVSAPKATGAKYIAFVDAIAPTFVNISGTSGSATIPAGFYGQGYVLLTNSEAITDAATVAGPAVIEVPRQATEFSY